ncbi:MAG: carboxypeptidase regulatory-like domain-containing protein, partial [Bryobacteraceae bacterium]
GVELHVDALHPQLEVAGSVRTPFNLAAITPDAKSVGGVQGFMIGGGQASAYGTSLDGVSANTTRALQTNWIASNTPSVEAIDQFAVDSAGYKAEFSHGAGNITFASKSGTNQFHGNVYWFLRNNALDANYFYNNLAGIPNSIYKQNDFGATFGGPVWIPKLYNGKNKTFFFFSYEGFRNRAGANGQTFTVPTAEMYNGNFANWVTAAGAQIPIFDPRTQVRNQNGTWTRSQFPGNVIPAMAFSGQALQALKAFQGGGPPLVGNNGARPGTVAYIQGNYYENTGTNVFPVNKASIKGDHLFNDKHRISGYYGWDRENQNCGADGCPTLPGNYTTYNNAVYASDVIRFQWDWTLSPTKLNHFYAGGNNWREDHQPPQQLSGTHWKDQFCIPNVPNCDENLATLFNGASSTYSTWGGPADNGSENTVYGYNDDFTWVKGNHTMKFGGTYQLTHYNGFGRQCEAGCVGFSYQQTGVPGGSNPNAGGNSFASFLLGYADNAQIDTVRFIGQQFYYFAGFAQDDWRVNRKLVLNLGLRWDGNLPPTGLDDKWSDFSPNTPNPGANNIAGAVLFAGTGEGRIGSRRFSSMWPSGFGPHIGLAYSYDQKTVIRASYARSFGALQAVSGSTHNQGFTLTQNFNNTSNGILPTFTLDGGIPPWTAPPFIDPSVSNGSNISWFQGQETTKLPAYNNFNFSIQRQLSNSFILDVGYVGVMGEHLQARLLQYNSLPGSDLTMFGSTVNSINVLNSLVGSPLANQYGITAPFPQFSALWGSRATVAQALRAYPQYTNIDTYSGQGDHSGHSTYNALQVKLQKRYGAGLVLQTSYVFSKLLTDADNAWGTSAAADQYNRGLEKSIGAYDITHDFKFSASYQLPFGRGEKWLRSGPASWFVGNWRVAAISVYDSGTPVGISSSLTLPIYASGAAGRSAPYVNSLDGWQPNSFDFQPNQPFFFVPYQTAAQMRSGASSGPFPYQGDLANPNNSLADQGLGIGNMTRFNPKVRNFANLNENISLTRVFPIHERIRVEFRAEAFNAFNRVRFGTGSTLLQSQQFGQPVGSGIQTNTPRQLQLALKLNF